MEKKTSLLNQIKSKYILQKILSVGYGDIKSVLKLLKYNKNLINKLDINIKDYYNYKFKTKIKKNIGCCFSFIMISHIILVFIPYLIYIILFFKIGKFNDKNLIIGYDTKKKSFVDFMNNYILLVYFLFIIISYLLNILINICKIIILKGLQKGRFKSIFASVDFFHYILYIIKYSFTEKIMVSIGGLLQKWDNKNYSILTRSHNFDGILILFLSFMILFYLFFQCHFWIHHKEIMILK